MRRALGIVAAVLVSALAYLLFWPVSVRPVAWSPPADLGLTGAYTPNEILGSARSLDLDGFHGPEDLCLGRDGQLYATVLEGVILRIPRHGGRPHVFATTGGRPLGIDAMPNGALVVANAELGLQRVDPDGSVTSLIDSVDGAALRYADDVAADDDGKIYFTEASTKFAATAYGGTLEGSVLDLLEHGGNGFLAEFEPASGKARVLLDGLDFPNGVAVSDDQTFLLVAETGSYRILRYWLDGPDAGTAEVLIDNLPGFPDNIDNGLNGRFWVGLVAPRKELLDRLAPRPFLRRILARLPRFLRPKPVLSSHVFAINGAGEVLMNLQDPAARFPLLTGVLELPDRLYLSTLGGPHLPFIDKQDLL
jgi:sugar lactone lactonase YvrE